LAREQVIPNFEAEMTELVGWLDSFDHKLLTEHPEPLLSNHRDIVVEESCRVVGRSLRPTKRWRNSSSQPTGALKSSTYRVLPQCKSAIPYARLLTSEGQVIAASKSILTVIAIGYMRSTGSRFS
jgi:hypothetical protein